MIGHVYIVCSYIAFLKLYPIVATPERITSTIDVDSPSPTEEGNSYPMKKAASDRGLLSEEGLQLSSPVVSLTKSALTTESMSEPHTLIGGIRLINGQVSPVKEDCSDGGAPKISREKSVEKAPEAAFQFSGIKIENTDDLERDENEPMNGDVNNLFLPLSSSDDDIKDSGVMKALDEYCPEGGQSEPGDNNFHPYTVPKSKSIVNW